MAPVLKAPAIREIVPGVFAWEIFSPEHKVELASHAVLKDGELFCFDPVGLAEEPFAWLSRRGTPAAIVLTNENHLRQSELWQERWRVPIWTSVRSEVTLANLRRFPEGPCAWEGWRLHPLAGGGGGETALGLPGRSLMVLGDAVVNLPGRGLEFLPAHYCRDPAILRQSVRELAREPFDHLLMAHGAALLSHASRRLAELG